MAHQALSRGFNWLGGATIVARLVDVATTLAMLLLLTRQQLGVASLVISVGMVIEAFNGLGTGDALIQARSIDRPQLDTLFWYVLGASLLVAAITLAAAPSIAALYGVPGMATCFLAIAAKQPLVAAALIPLAMMSRELQFKRIALVNVGATLAAALTRLALGAAGAGSWALVAGYAASGFYTLVGAFLLRPFRPRVHLRPAVIRPLVQFGLRNTVANLSEQLFKNIDYLLIGRFYGTAELAIYRVAFDIAMEPAMAVGTLVSRTALPVLARVAHDRNELARTLRWSLRRIAILVAPLMTVLVLAAGPLTALLHDHAGHSYAASATPLRLLAIAALLRVILQLISTVLVGSGHPGAAARLSATALLLLGAGVLAAGLLFRAQTGIIAVAAVWLAIYPLLLAMGLRALQQNGKARQGLRP